MKLILHFKDDTPKKTEDDGMHPASDYAVVEDPQKPSTWHLPIYDKTHLGPAHAALLSPTGYRGNKYAGPQKAKAIAKLKAAYKKFKMEWPKD